MSESSPETITRLLRDWRGGRARALDELVPLVYDELRRVAARLMASERSGHTLQPTALLHEAYGRLVDADVDWQDRAHFFAVAARTMRRVLLDHARRRGRVRRGGGWQRVEIREQDGAPDEGPAPLDLIALDRALSRLEALDARKGRLVELHYFGGMTWDEIAEVLSTSRSTVARELRIAKAWLKRDLDGAAADGDA